MLAGFFFVFAGWDLGEGDFAGGQLPRPPPPNFFGACGGLKEESIFSERAFGALGWDLGGRHFTGEGGRKTLPAGSAPVSPLGSPDSPPPDTPEAAPTNQAVGELYMYHR